MIAASKHAGMLMRLMEFEQHLPSCSNSVGMYNMIDKSFFTVLRGNANTIRLPLSYNKQMYQIAFSSSKPDLHVQPAELYNNEHAEFLWMEGQIEDTEIEKLQAEGQTDDKWSVRLFLRHILGSGIPIGIDGQYACIYSDGLEMYAFRNDYGSLFCDRDMNICTRPFSGSNTLPANKLYRLDFEKNMFIGVGDFETVRKLEMM